MYKWHAHEIETDLLHLYIKINIGQIDIKRDVLKPKLLFSNVSFPVVIGVNLYVIGTNPHLYQSKLDFENIKIICVNQMK